MQAFMMFLTNTTCTLVVHDMWILAYKQTKLNAECIKTLSECTEIHACRIKKMNNPVCLFRLILIAEKDIVYKKFPTPLINRLEKHFVLTSTVLEEWQCKALEDFKKWIKDFSQTIARYFTLVYYLFPLIYCVLCTQRFQW